MTLLLLIHCPSRPVAVLLCLEAFAWRRSGYLSQDSWPSGCPRLKPPKKTPDNLSHRYPLRWQGCYSFFFVGIYEVPNFTASTGARMSYVAIGTTLATAQHLRCAAGAQTDRKLRGIWSTFTHSKELVDAVVLVYPGQNMTNCGTVILYQFALQRWVLKALSCQDESAKFSCDAEHVGKMNKCLCNFVLFHVS